MKLSFITAALEEYAPLAIQEKWHNSGLQVGLPEEAEGECTGALLCVDVTPEIIAEAVRLGCNLVISHHPLLFKGVKNVVGRTPSERTLAAAIRSGVAVYSSHTALDSTRGGISYEMAARLGATPLRVLAPVTEAMVLMTVTCPRNMAADVRLILLDSDAPGCDYYDVERESIDTASDPLERLISHTPLCKVEARVKASSAGRITSALRSMPGGDGLKVLTSPVDNDDLSVGLGLVASFDVPVKGSVLLDLVKERFKCPVVKSSLGFDADADIRRIALCGGAGGEFIGVASAAAAQVYITADVRYHDFADSASSPMAVFDIGHFESESCAKDLFYRVIKNKFPNFAVYYSEMETNPVKYL